MIFKKKTNEYSKEITFKFYSKSESLFLNFYDNIKKLGVIPKSIISDEEYFDDFDEKVRKEIKKGLIINLKNGDSLHVSVNKHNDENIYSSSFYFKYNDKFLDRINMFISESEGLYYAILTNYYDVKWQNEESISTYKINKKSLKGLKYTIDLWDKECIDITQNYGRSIFKDGVLYIAGYCSWFGDIIEDSIFDKADFLYSKSKLPNGLLRVQLFKDLETEYSLYRNKQKEFLQILDII